MWVIILYVFFVWIVLMGGGVCVVVGVWWISDEGVEVVGW